MDARDHRPSPTFGATKDVDPQQRSVAGRHLDVAFYDDVGRRIGDGDRRLGDAANPLQRIPESTGTSPRPVQGR
ncbi:hypothetical protein MRGA423_07575 [Mycobacterium tuberculosis RGTB423]|nr:hypothetical protein MRGA423_07575 [Mycobacterium tuberculosis RGTB423]